jgi:hypothetical protein
MFGFIGLSGVLPVSDTSAEPVGETYRGGTNSQKSGDFWPTWRSATLLFALG